MHTINLKGKVKYERIALKHVYYTCKIDDHCKFDTWSKAPKAGALGQPSGMGGEGCGRGV